MLPKERRIERKHFPLILAKGFRYNSPKLLLYIAKNPENKPSKVAFSVSKKVASLAVDRNKYRRLGYVSIKPYLNKTKKGLFLFFSFKKGSIPTKIEQLDKEIHKLLSDAGVLE